MKRFFTSEWWRERGGAVVVGGSVLLILIMLPVLLLLNGGLSPQPTLTTPVSNPPTPPIIITENQRLLPTPTLTPALPTPTPGIPARTAQLNPQHGIHAPIGNQWTDTLRESLSSFKDRNGQSGAPGLVVALSSDMSAANNRLKIRLEEDLHQYERQGAQIYVRMYPQRFPGGFEEAFHTEDNPNTLSGSPRLVAQDIFNFLVGQQKRNGWHFSRIMVGNEPDLEWPNELYGQNLLAWQSNGDPAKYVIMNRFYKEVYAAWQQRQAQPDARQFQDIELYFPALAQDATPGPDYYAGFNYYDGSKPVGNRYDALREAIETYGRFSWHNYFQPGRACLDIAANAFPDWLQADLEKGWPVVISEAGWAPDSLVLPSQNDSRAKMVRFWHLLGLKWDKSLYEDNRPQWRTQDELIGGSRFEEDVSRFVGGCDRGNLKLSQPVGAAIWLAGSEGNFIAAVGVEPGPVGPVRRWLRAYAGLPL